MTKTVMSARITDQHLTLVNVPLIASGGVDEIRIHFQFCGLWDGCGKTAVFYRDPSEVYHVPIADGSVIVPHEVLAEEGFFYFGVMGTGDNIRTSEVVRIYVTQGAITTATANHEEPTPGIYQQVLAACGKTESTLSSRIEQEQADRKAEIAVERARIDQMVAMGGSEGGKELVYNARSEDGWFLVNLWSDGVSANILVLPNYDVIPKDIPEDYSYTFRGMPRNYAPLGVGVSVYVDNEFCATLGIDSKDDLTLYIYSSTLGTGYGQEYYPLATPYIFEVGDIRVDHEGNTHPSAGDAVRSIGARVDGAVQEIVDTICPPFTEIGRAVRCEPVKDHPINVRSHFAAAFSGEDPVPCDDFEVELYLCGKNLYNPKVYPLTAGRYIAGNGKLTDYSQDGNYAATEGFIPVFRLKGLQITLNHPPVETGGNNPRLIFYTDADGSAVITGSGANGYTHTVPANANYMRFSVPKKYADGSQVQIELGTQVTSFEAYRDPDYFRAVPPSVSDFYQGYFDWNTGELYSTHDLVDGQLREKTTPEMVAATTPTVIRPKGSSFIYSTTGDTEVSGRSDPGALIDILTRKLNSLSTAAVAVPEGSGAL